MENEIVKRNMEYVFERYFCPQTELFYEFVIDEENNAWHHLPEVKEVNESIPNPCGWGTGMEDSAMNGGSAIDALILAYNYTKDRRIKSFVDAIFRGLMRCAASDKNEGFISRSISPFDGKSHYIESSRDQYTHWIYGILQFYNSSLCDEEQKEKIRLEITKIAKKCERDVTKENEYHMLREDGTVGMVNKMWGELGTHEFLRLPMFYLAAFYVTKDNHWQEMYLKYRDKAIEKSTLHKPDEMRCYASLQMQCSLRAIYQYDNDVKVKSKVKEIMQKNAEYGMQKAIENSTQYCKIEHREAINYRFHKWNEVEPFRLGIFSGYNYDNPAQSEREDNSAFYPVREIAEGAIMATMCPGFKVTELLLKAVDDMAECIDIRKHSSIYAPLLLSCAHISCKENILNQKDF